MNEQERKAHNERRRGSTSGLLAGVVRCGREAEDRLAERVPSGRVDLERLRRAMHLGERVAVYGDELEALVAVVDAARAVTTDPGPEQDALLAALEPFAPTGEVAELDAATAPFKAMAERVPFAPGLLGAPPPARVDGRVFNVAMQERERARRLAALGIELVGCRSAWVLRPDPDPDAVKRPPGAGRVDAAYGEVVAANERVLLGRVAELEARVSALVEALREVAGKPCDEWTRQIAREALAAWEQA